MFIPATPDECRKQGWSELDVILISGDAYIDSPQVGVALIGKILMDRGYRVGIISQPDIHSDEDVGRLGTPRLFWGITGGCVDSMVANYTAGGKPRRSDDFTPGMRNEKRPDRACVVYANLVRRYFKDTAPIVLGGIEASLRRISHYDFWSRRVRRSVLFDARADYLLYGMADHTVVLLADRLAQDADPRDVPGLCYIAKTPPAGYLELPSHQTVSKDPSAFEIMFHRFYRHTDPVTAKGLVQLQDTRYLVQNPPPPALSGKELDAAYGLAFERAVHPADAAGGPVRALDTIAFSLTTHRGCYGECNFCAIAVHQGRRVMWRSTASIVQEAECMVRHPDFKGRIHDVGGPTANMYGFECDRKMTKGACRHRRCMFPDLCPELPVSHAPQIDLLERLSRITGVTSVVVASGIRCDLVAADHRYGDAYTARIAGHHVSGQLKVAPEHIESNILQLMGKSDTEHIIDFRKAFIKWSRSANKRQYLTYYFIAAHPGCDDQHMRNLSRYARNTLRIRPRQVQIFTPTPSTYSTLMYMTESDPFTGKDLFVETDPARRRKQKDILTGPVTPRRRRCP